MAQPNFVDNSLLSQRVYVYQHTAGTRGITPDRQPWSFWSLEKTKIEHGAETFIGVYTLGTLVWH